jgi:ATP synthase mitochondrial F1 complex assembly factor 2
MNGMDRCRLLPNLMHKRGSLLYCYGNAFHRYSVKNSFLLRPASCGATLANRSGRSSSKTSSFELSHADLDRLQRQRRHYYSSTPCNYSTSDNHVPRKVGRQRFYVDVGVMPCPPPWETTAKSSTSNDSMIKSPISAGVDGTDSASGVARTVLNHDSNEYRDRIMVRSPTRQLLQATTIDPPLYTSLNGYSIEDNATKTTSVCSDNWYTVTLDGRSLRTPLGRQLAVPSEALAHMIAVEWNSVQSVITPLQMPLMTLTCTALDQVAAVGGGTGAATASYQSHCLQYLQTDTICYWAEPVEDRVLYSRQQSAWQSLYSWIENDFCLGLPLPAQVYGMDYGALFASRQTSSSSRRRGGLAHDDALVNAATTWVQSLDAWHLTCLYVACAEAKSFWIAAAIVTQHVDAIAAQTAARVEEEFNIASWGLVEGQHDYDRLNSAVQLRSVSLLVKLLSV